MRASKTILSILHRGFDEIKQGGRIMVLDEKAVEKLYDRLCLEKSDEDTLTRLLLILKRRLITWE